jgi:hypothetical protein
MQKKDEHIGQKLKSYNFIKKLGAGAWAIVYEVFDEKTHTSVACKCEFTQARSSPSDLWMRHK